MNKLFGYLPQLFGAAVLAGVAWLVATIARRAVSLGAERLRLEEKVRDEAGVGGAGAAPLGKTLSTRWPLEPIGPCNCWAP